MTIAENCRHCGQLVLRGVMPWVAKNVYLDGVTDPRGKYTIMLDGFVSETRHVPPAERVNGMTARKHECQTRNEDKAS